MQRPHLRLMLRNARRPVLDGANGRNFVEQPGQRRRGVTLTGRKRVLKDDQRQIGGRRDRLEMCDRHVRALAERERRRRKHQKRRRSAGLRPFRNPGRLEAAVRPDPVDQRQPVADLLAGDLQHAALLIGRARGHLGRMRIDRERRQALDRRDVPQMAAETRLVDRQIVMERQQHRGDHSLGNKVFKASHGDLHPIYRWSGEASQSHGCALVERPHESKAGCYFRGERPAGLDRRAGHAVGGGCD